MDALIDMSWWHLASGYLLYLIPIGAFVYYKTGLAVPTLWAALRMTVQLVLVGLYLNYIFQWDNPFINLAWILIMITIASSTTVKRSQLNPKLFFGPVFLSLLISFLVVDGYFFVVVLNLDNVLEAKYFIPITGMIMGNLIKVNVMALNRFYKSLRSNLSFFHYSLGNGATLGEALLPFTREALQTAFNPTIAGMAVMGLIALPGMMTGQILGGTVPLTAIKYQIIIQITIFSGTMSTVLITMAISRRFLFDANYNLNPDIMKRRVAGGGQKQNPGKGKKTLTKQ